MSANPHVEEIDKPDLANGLKEATKRTKKGEYHKTKHAPDLLAAISPERVRRAAPNCRKLFDRVLAKWLKRVEGARNCPNRPALRQVKSETWSEFTPKRRTSVKSGPSSRPLSGSGELLVKPVRNYSWVER